MKPTFPPRRTLLLYIWSGERRRGKVYERLTHKNSDTPEQITFHRAVVDHEREDLMLSVYAGKSGQPLELVQTYVGRNWDELSSYLQSSTPFRRSDFHADS